MLPGTTPPPDAADRLILTNDFASLWRDVGESALQAFEEVGKQGWYILGPEVRAFERDLSDFCGLHFAAGCASGLDAIELGLRALDLQPGDKVLTTPLSAFATTLAILRAGGELVFVDVDECGLIDLDACERALTSHPEIRFFVPVDLYGHAIDVDRLQALRQKYRLKIVEDAAQAIGANHNGKPVGAAADLTTISFYPTKNLGCFGDGGAVLGKSESLIERVKMLRDYGQSDKYVHSEVGLNSRLDEVHAAIMRKALLPRLPHYTARRQAVGRRYMEGIRSERLRLPGPPGGSSSVFHLFPVMADDRDGFRKHLESKGIQTGVHYPTIIPDQPALSNVPFSVLGDLTRAREYASHEVSLPIHPFLADEDVARVIEGCCSWR